MVQFESGVHICSHHLWLGEQGVIYKTVTAGGPHRIRAYVCLCRCLCTCDKGYGGGGDDFQGSVPGGLTSPRCFLHTCFCSRGQRLLFDNIAADILVILKLF